MKQIKAVSLFANIGIGETYLKDLGIDVVVSNELLKDRTALYSHLYPETKMIQGDITNPDIFSTIISEAQKQDIDLLIATPPCQGMSIAGKMKEDDPRNTLIIKAMEAFELLQPKFMLIENVTQMLSTSILFNHSPVKIVDFIKSYTDKYGYEVSFDIFDAKDYNTPQVRKRAIIRIHKKGLTWDSPAKGSVITVKDSIGDLPSLEAGQSSGIKYHYAKSHNANHIEWMKHTPTGKTAFDNEFEFKPKKDGRIIKGFSTTYKRISWDKPAPTITMACGSISSQNNVHPGVLREDGTYSDARVLTLLELFRLTGLPDDWNIPSTVSDNTLRHYIGEAVPPKMMKALLEPILKNFK